MLTKITLNKKLIFTILILGALMLVAILSQSNQSSIFENAPINDQGEYIIEFTDEGFVPANIIVRVGDTIRFTNTTDQLFWPASNVHPHHETYPEFDPKIPIDPYESWAFQFDEIGRWTFHDHISPWLGGSILVLDSSTKVEDLIKCFEFDSIKKYEKKGCFEDFQVHYISLMNSRDAFSVLQRAYELKPELIYSQDSCHNHAHIIGDIAYQEYLEAGSIKDAGWPEEVVSMCAGGFIHGFLEHYAEESLDPGSIPKFCAELKEAYPEREHTIVDDCYHGVGHGLALEPEYGSAEWGDGVAMVQPAIDKCREYVASDGPQALERCFSGAFSSIAIWRGLGFNGLSIQQAKDNPLGLCKQLNEDVRFPCYVEESTVLASEVNFDIRVALEEYGPHLTDYDMKLALVEVAVPAYLFTNQKDISYEEAISLCRDIEKSLLTPCIHGLVEGYIHGGIDYSGYSEVVDFCKSSELNSEEKQICYDKLFLRGLTLYSQELVQDICMEFEDEYQDTCDFSVQINNYKDNISP